MFPTGGQFMQQFGVVPVSLPYEDVQPAIQTGELDGVWWCGITEAYTVGWADVTKYYLTNNVSGAWAGSYFVNTEKWKALPEHLQQLFRMCIDWSHYYRLHWYWWGEAHYRTTGGKPNSPPFQTQNGRLFRTRRSHSGTMSPRPARVAPRSWRFFKKYNETMNKAGPPYRY